MQPGHAALADHLESAGHDHDGWPMRMAAPLDEVDLDGSPDELEVGASWRDVGRINDAAYGLPGELERLLASDGADGTHAYVARVDGTPAACAMVVETGADAYVSLVATVPACRGRGLARALMATGLRAARERGCVTTSLEASPMGEPIYARMGYRSLGRFGLWERREPAASA